MEAARQLQQSTEIKLFSGCGCCSKNISYLAVSMHNNTTDQFENTNKTNDLLFLFYSKYYYVTHVSTTKK